MIDDFPEEFPDDLNGDVLRRMVAHGDDLEQPRDIDFNMVFQNEAGASDFFGIMAKFSMRAELNPPNEHTAWWEVQVITRMLPTHDGITAMEERLESLAEPFGGRNDGWGCLQVDKVERRQ